MNKGIEIKRVRKVRKGKEKEKKKKRKRRERRFQREGEVTATSNPATRSPILTRFLHKSAEPIGSFLDP